MTWNASWNYTDTANHHDGDWEKDGENEHVFMLSLSLPLSQWLPNTYANYNVTGNNKNSVSHQVGLNGRLLQNNNLNWNIQQSVDESGGSTGEFGTGMGRGLWLHER